MLPTDLHLEYHDHTFLNIQAQRIDSPEKDKCLSITHQLRVIHLPIDKEVQFFLRTFSTKDCKNIKINILAAAKYNILEEELINEERLIEIGRSYVSHSLYILTTQLLTTLFSNLSIYGDKLPLLEGLELKPEDIIFKSHENKTDESS